MNFKLRPLVAIFWVLPASAFWLIAAPPLAALPQVPTEASAKAPVAPLEVIKSAIAAVASLGDSVVLGRYQVAVERMNPQWKEATAARIGGKDELERQLASVAQEMVKQGITITSFKPVGTPQSFEVSPGKKTEIIDGQETDTLIFNRWLIMIPTSTTFRVVRQGQKTVIIESMGFQVAISDKGKNDWTFIDGSGLTLSNLRSMFVNLPMDIALPPIHKHEVR